MSLVLSKVSAVGPWGTRLEEVELTLPSGAITAIVGPGGSGKTLLLDVLGGAATIHHGEIACTGESDPRIVYQSAAPLLASGDTVEKFFAEHDLTVPDAFGLKELASLTVESLPARYRRALWLVAAISRPAEVYLFDEPTLGFDISYRRSFIDLLRPLVDGGAAIAIATVDLQLASSVADYAIILGDGKIVKKGSVEEISQEVEGQLFEQLWKLHCTE